MGMLVSPYRNAVVTYTTLDSGDKESTITLSNGDLTATKNATSGAALVMARHGKGTGTGFGKVRFQVTVVNVPSGGNFRFGIVGAFYKRGQMGDNDQSIAVVNGGGGVKHGNITQAASGLTIANGDVFDFYLDAENNLLSIRKNDVAILTNYSAFSAMARSIFPAAYLFEANGALTFNFGATPWTYSGDTSYSAWPGSQPADATTFRTAALFVRSAGNFTHKWAETQIMASSGGTNILLSSTATASDPVEAGNPTATPDKSVDGNTSTVISIQTNGGSAQAPIWVKYDIGSNAARNATHFAIVGPGTGAESQAPTLMDLFVSDGSASGNFYKAKVGITLSAFTSGGQRQEVAL